MDAVLDNLDEFFDGMWSTAVLTLVSFAFAAVLGGVVAGFRVSPVPPLRAAGAFYVNVVRNTPLAVLFILFYFGLTKVGLVYEPFTTAILLLSLYTGTFVGETVRSGINAVARGQGEAARSLGMTFPQLLGVIVLPQAVRTVVQPLGSIFIALIKNSALVTIISVPNLGRTADALATETAQVVPIYLGAAVAYLLLTLPAGQAVGWLERRVAIRR